MEMFKQEAKHRQKELGKSHGEDPSGKFTGRGEARDQAGKAVGVSGKTVSHAGGGKSNRREVGYRMQTGRKVACGGPFSGLPAGNPVECA